MKTIITKSGIRGYQCKLRDNYTDFEEFKAYSETYNLHGRLGYKSPKSAWEQNPIIQGSINPSDYRKIKNK